MPPQPSNGLPIEALAAGVATFLGDLCPARAGVPSWAAIALSLAGGHGGLAGALCEATTLGDIRACCAAIKAVLEPLEPLPHIVAAAEAVYELEILATPPLAPYLGAAAYDKLIGMLERHGTALGVARKCAS